jgi:hypothetical protein
MTDRSNIVPLHPEDRGMIEGEVGRSRYRYRGVLHRLLRRTTAGGGAFVSAPKVCPLIARYCKRGHPRTMETTFERKVCIKKNGREYHYIARECRVCHAMRYNKTAASWRKFQSRSKWSAIRQGVEQ